MVLAYRYNIPPTRTIGPPFATKAELLQLLKRHIREAGNHKACAERLGIDPRTVRGSLHNSGAKMGPAMIQALGYEMVYRRVGRRG